MSPHDSWEPGTSSVTAPSQGSQQDPRERSDPIVASSARVGAQTICSARHSSSRGAAATIPRQRDLDPLRGGDARAGASLCPNSRGTPEPSVHQTALPW